MSVSLYGFETIIVMSVSLYRFETIIVMSVSLYRFETIIVMSVSLYRFETLLGFILYIELTQNVLVLLKALNVCCSHEVTLIKFDW